MTNDTSGNLFIADGTAVDIPDETMIMVKARDIKNRLEWLMFCLGQYGFDVMLRYDTLREDKNFTVQVGKYPRVDTNDPVGYLLEILQKKKGI
jgi:hypothetical protein